jgi:hypothetical protein
LFSVNAHINDRAVFRQTELESFHQLVFAEKRESSEGEAHNFQVGFLDIHSETGKDERVGRGYLETIGQSDVKVGVIYIKVDFHKTTGSLRDGDHCHSGGVLFEDILVALEVSDVRSANVEKHTARVASWFPMMSPNDARG